MSYYQEPDLSRETVPLSSIFFILLFSAEFLPLTAGCDALTELVLKKQLLAATAAKAVLIPSVWIAAALCISKFLLRKLSE